MIPRYTRPEMGGIWSDARRYDAWLEVELAATDALAEAGVVPVDDARALRERASFDIGRIEEIEQVTQHDVIAFTTAVAERVGPAARWLHFGLTSSDVLDTALALQMRAGLRPHPARRGRAGRGDRTRADEHQAHADDRPHARCACRAHDVRRETGALVRRGPARAASGSSGRATRCRSARSRVRSDVCASRSVDGSARLPRGWASSRRRCRRRSCQRDRHAELLTALAILAASLEKFALEIRGLQKTEIGEVEEPFGRGQKGSSAMPHKRTRSAVSRSPAWRG